MFATVGAVKAALVLALLAALTAHHPQRCFGAAARASAACTKPILSVTPTPADAPLQTSAPCTPVPASLPETCTFGAPGLTPTVALLGDSHAVHWRAPLEVVAKTQHWRGVTLYRSSCPFTAAFSTLIPEKAAACQQWKADVRAYFAQHPEVTTVFTSANAGSGVAVPPGADRFETKVGGYLDAWSELPPTVTKLVVIADVPQQRTSTPVCVERALKRHRDPGRACAIPRASALRPDPMVVAAARRQLQVIDLTRYMCDRRRCYPVVGGVLVHKDRGHLTRTFATTLAPYLIDQLNSGMATLPANAARTTMASVMASARTHAGRR
jgi:hypothetical protein